MTLALICSQSDLAPDLAQTALWREGVERHVVTRLEEAQLLALAARPDIVVVDRELPRADQLVAGLRGDAATRSLSIAVVARGDFEPAEVDLLEAGANAILRLPPGPDWSDRLQALMSVPVRTESRLPVRLRLVAFPEAGAGTAHPGVAVNLSSNGLLLETEAVLQPGDELDLEMELDAAESLHLHGRVVRLAGPRQAGVAFVGHVPEPRARIARFVESGATA